MTSTNTHCSHLARFALTLFFLGSLTAACGSMQTNFPPGVAPLLASQAGWPVTGAEEPLELARGEEEDGTVWVHARGYIDAPLPDVIDAFADPGLMVDARVVDEWDVEWDVEPGYVKSARVKQIMHRLISIEFFVTWRHGERRDSNGDLEEYAVVYQKTDGTTLIERMDGSIIARRDSPTRTSIEIVSQIRAYEYTPGKLAWSVRGMFDSLQSAVVKQQDVKKAGLAVE